MPVGRPPSVVTPRSEPRMTTTRPGPIARQPIPGRHTAAVRVSSPSNVASGCGSRSDGSQRSPNSSRCGTTATLGSKPSAGAKRRRSCDIPARIRLHSPSAIAPADEPPSAAPFRQAPTTAPHAGVPLVGSRRQAQGPRRTGRRRPRRRRPPRSRGRFHPCGPEGAAPGRRRRATGTSAARSRLRGPGPGERRLSPRRRPGGRRRQQGRLDPAAHSRA